MNRIIPALLMAALISGACLQTDDVVSLNGPWKWRKGFKKEWLQTRNPPGDWNEVVLPRDIGKNLKEIRGYKGWLTLRRELPESINQALRSRIPLGVNSGWLGDVSFIYLNDSLFGQNGSANPYKSGYSRFVLKALPFLENPPANNYLYIVLYSPGVYRFNVEGPYIEIGPVEQVDFRFYRGEIISLILIMIYVAVGLYHLLLAIRRRQDIHNLYFGIFSVMISFYWFCRTPTRDFFFGDNFLLRLKAELFILFLVSPILLFFLSNLFEKKHDRVSMGFLGFWSILAIVTLVSPAYNVVLLCLSIWQITAIVFMIYIIYYISRLVYLRKPDSGYLIAGIVILVLAALHDILAARAILNTPHIARYSFVLFVVGIAGVLANRFVRVHNEVEELNTNLEQKVRKRTEQLQNTLNNIRTLKEQQDGDYFLTSLLIEPLGRNLAESRNVSIEMFTRQKKRFRFRKWDSEIGGDLNIAYSIDLKGRSYTVFLNGDAMGKSIQGAGGSLVLGTVFKSVIARTQMTAQAREIFPEIWLKNVFIELQNVFVTFDGSMLVSIVLGMVDDETGFMYFINAEHPPVVLYRNHRAVFIEDESMFHKVGIDQLKGSLYIETFQLMRDDVIFVGSDGRDDLLLGYDDEGYRIINEDESEFLRHVEVGEGVLKGVVEAIERFGEILDDLTIIRIGFKEDFPARQLEADERIPEELEKARNLASEMRLTEAIEICETSLKQKGENPEVMKTLSRLYMKSKNYEKAAVTSQNYIEVNPADTEYIFISSYALKRTGALNEAVDLGERCRLRDPKHIKNLVNLADIYRLQGNEERARMILNLALQADSQNAEALKLESRLKSSES